MMKTTRKLFALLLALVLMLSLAVPAMADDANPADTAKTYTVTITGHTYEAYQIFKGDLDTSGTILSNIQWGEGINGAEFLAFLTAAERTTDLIFSETRLGENNQEIFIANVFAGCVTAEDVSKVLTAYSDKDAMLDTFAKYAGEYLKVDAEGDGMPQGTSTEGANNSYTISNLPAGYYLFKDQDESLEPGEGETEEERNDFYTKFMLEVVGDVPVSIKGSVPSISKTTSDFAETDYGETTTAMVGETVYFELTASLPSNFEIYNDYYFTFEDTMSEGLTFNKIEKVYIQRASEQLDIDASFIDGDLTDSASTAVKVTKNNDGSSSFQVKVGDLKAEDFPTLLLENTIVVRYSATVNDKAVLAGNGNPNTVDLKYSNNPYDEGEGSTGPDVAIVYTFGLDVDKHDKTDSTMKLENAQFVLYRRELYTKTLDDNTTQEMLRMHFVAADPVRNDEGEIVKYKPTGWIVVDDIAVAATTAQTWENAKTKLGNENLAKVTLTTNKDGEIYIPGLDIHTYHMLEIQAPDGYNLPRDPFRVVMTPTTDEDGNVKMSYQYGSGEAVTPEDGVADVSIANGKGNTLPSTGGMGTTLFYVIGGLMVAGAAVLLVTKKRMSEV